jgi:hypothetical protein
VGDDSWINFKQPINVIASEAKQSIAQQEERMDCFAALAMTSGYDFAISPRVFARGFVSFVPLSRKRAQGMPGARCTRSLESKKGNKCSPV